ncbi:hypothetical protein [Aquimonas voraii]|uniref:hypothetical protein n=1 Tax=Aquimonas voraii TaxID=265719 RepID=UPI00115FE850|nr:hypothetical protein [Aquimonas voraii]
MRKLYKNIDGKLRYHEAWASSEDGVATEHWGSVGEDGEIRQHPIPKGTSEAKMLKSILEGAAKNGFLPIPVRKHRTVVVEYKISEFGTDDDFKKRLAVDSHLNNVLGWTGLGHVDGGSTGSGTMEIVCVVVDPEVAIRVIKENMNDAQFSGYSRIYVEDA